MDLKEIKSLAEKKRYDEALAACEQLFDKIGTAEEKAELLKTRASIYSRLGDYERALKDREALFAMERGDAPDYFLAANNALSAGRIVQAVDWLNEVLRLGKEQNNSWFKSGSYFLLAYAKMELGQYQEAIANLDHAVAVESDVGMPLPGLCGMTSHQQLREEIGRRQTFAGKGKK